MSGAAMASDDPTAQDSYPRALVLAFLLNLKPSSERERQELNLPEQILLRLVDQNLSEFTQEYKIHSQSHKRRVRISTTKSITRCTNISSQVRLWQAVSLLIGRFYGDHMTELLMPKFWKILELQNLRSVRVYIEASFAFMLLHNPGIIDQRFIE